MQQLSLDALKGKGFTPQAVIAVPYSYFTDFRVQFDQEYDDLDNYRVAVISKLGRLPIFALIHYDGEPSETTTICLPAGLTGDAGAIVHRILRKFELPPETITWQRPNDDGVPARTAKRR
jgi:hypothetical protein